MSLMMCLLVQCQLRKIRVHLGEKQSEVGHGFGEFGSLGSFI